LAESRSFTPPCCCRDSKPRPAYAANLLVGSNQVGCFGYTSMMVSGDSHAFVARPEKALLDLVYLSPRGDSLEYILELRLQNFDSFDALKLLEIAQRTGSAKLMRAAERVAKLITEEGNR